MSIKGMKKLNKAKAPAEESKPGVTVLKGMKGELLAELAQLDAEKKQIEERVKEIKNILGIGPGKYKNLVGDGVTISEIDQYTDVPPKDFLAELKKQRLGKHFPSCVKVQAAPALKLLGPTVFNKLRTKTGSYLRWNIV